MTAYGQWPDYRFLAEAEEEGGIEDIDLTACLLADQTWYIRLSKAEDSLERQHMLLHENFDKEAHDQVVQNLIYCKVATVKATRCVWN